MKQVLAEAVEHTNIRGKKSLHVRFKADGHEDHIIDVGQATFDKINKMQENGKTELPLGDKPKANEVGNKK